MLNDWITLYEVGPRDGLQYESITLDTETRIQFIDSLAKSGLKYIESGSFVSPKAVPQMQHTAQVMAGIRRQANVRYPVLVPNEHGMQAAITSEVDTIAVFTAASNTFLQHNIRCDIEESFRRFEPVVALARTHQIAVRGYVSCSMGCPYEGAVPLSRVVNVAKKLLDVGCYEVSIADTTGVGRPEEVPVLIEALLVAGVPVERLAVHFHDTPERLALAKIDAAIQKGIRTIDAAVGNLGGCPYAPGASGNVATEDVIHHIEAQGFKTGIDMSVLAKATADIFKALGREPGT